MPLRVRQAGFTLLETIISITLVAVVLQTVVSTTLLMTRSGEFGARKTRLITRTQEVLQRLGQELRNSSRDTDPATGIPYVVATGNVGDMQLDFRRVANFGTNGAELVPIWSTPITLLISNGQLVRQQDNIETVLLNGVETLDFSVDSLGRIDLQIGVRAEADATSGNIQRLVHHVRASPQR